MKLTLVLTTLAFALVGSVAAKHKVKKPHLKSPDHFTNLKIPKKMNLASFPDESAKAMFNQSKSWSKLCTDYAVDQTSYVFDVYTFPIYIGLRRPSSNCTIYDEKADTITDVTSEVFRKMYQPDAKPPPTKPKPKGMQVKKRDEGNPNKVDSHSCKRTDYWQTAKNFSKACTNTAVSQQKSVYNVKYRSNTDRFNCTAYDSAKDSFTDLTAQVTTKWVCK